ncbi:MAG: sigma-54 dependent transcriptional regulator [Gemmatimonadaceae bacterium]|nr:sigma-54 dependent transcriptional regulator [Gemmatimonadaceae bacterium]
MTTPRTGIRVLLADDEPHLGAILEQFLTARGFAVTAVRDGRAALDALRTAPFDVALLDVVMPEMDGLEVLRRVREESTPPEILIITGNGTVETALAALRLGAYDVLSKPYRMAEIEAVIRRAWEKRMLVRENHRLRARLAIDTSAAPAFVTQYAPLRAVLATLEPLRADDAPVLVWGEAGVGKRAFARWLHDGRGADAAWIECNAAVDTPGALARLLGTEVPGAEPVVQVGALEAAAGGTLFVRAFARLDHAAQRQIAEAVARGWFVRQGGTQPVPLECRVVVALMRDPDVLVAEGGLDAEAAHTLSAVRVVLPPLRERAVDVPLLATAALPSGRTLSADAIAWLESRDWPGNVRALVDSVRRAAQLTTAAEVTAADLTAAESGAARDARPGARADDRAASPAAAVTTASGTSGTGPAPRTLEAVERAYIADTLQAVGWHQGRAAEALGISPKTLYRKIREYGFVRPSGRTLR